MLVLLPGLGADARLFEPQRELFPGLIVPEWVTPKTDETLEEFGSRMVERIPRHGDLVLGGVSFGGMIAAQIAPVIKPKALILIGTCLHPREIARTARMAARAAPLMSDAFTDSMRMLAPGIVHALGPFTDEQRDGLLEMSHAVPASFLRWAATAIFGWKGAPQSPCPVRRIHGRADRVIPCPATGVDDLIEGAGHVPSFTHSRRVNEVIARVLEI